MSRASEAFRSPAFWIGLGAAVAYLALHKRTYSYGGPDFKDISRDPRLLVPAFADQLEKLFQAMRDLGFDPVLHEGYRSPARAKALAATGAGIVDSMHIYGGAADIVSASSGWSDPTFFKALGREAKKLGMTWGGDFKDKNGKPDPDGTHVQAMPILLQKQFVTLSPSQRQVVLQAQYARFA